MDGLMDGGFGGGARIGRAGRKSLDSQLVVRKTWTRGTAFNSLQDYSQETPGLTDGLEFVRVIPTDWPAVCPDRHRKAIHLILSLFLSHLTATVPRRIIILVLLNSYYTTTTHNLQSFHPSIHPSITKKKKKKKKKILQLSPTRTLPCAIHPIHTISKPYTKQAKHNPHPSDKLPPPDRTQGIIQQTQLKFYPRLDPSPKKSRG
ncbi:uncharacterized protein BO88DRAFT_413781 [Aspergillus vadensis CBS 113365]|uniref:Uncharacterized protein n=1 Tax=Aspergillus vadensis (strain CBS 113365 / IMI 142717 / IBT 24658) TaxID=1448311 RepID=A0A319BF96_ASPVC|nr:hypothetical protein BO88DRAFT_413781 [Aspergillus vadensis CBS 113365]PYH70779.1 hypothetical protein BO88DRAFT_413781 [Aspergillus vadensis CBS 113365]